MADVTQRMEAVLSARDNGYTRTLKSATSAIKTFSNAQKGLASKTISNATKALGAMNSVGIATASRGLKALGATGKASMGILATSASKLGNTLKTIGTVGAVAGIGAVTVASAKGGEALSNYQDSMAKLSRQTGVTGDALKGLGKTVEDIYSRNLGDSILDVSGAVANAKQILGGTNDEIENSAQAAIKLNSAFESIDIPKAMSAAKKMMVSFGISSEQAFNMMYEGAQNGLNQQDDMVDTLNEYSVFYKQLGMSAEDMFASLQNGLNAGVRNTDLMADAIKEMNIRLVDGSESSKEGFRLIGKDAVESARKIKAGGATAREEYKSIITAIVNMKDPLKQNTAAVDLLGTKYEDIGDAGLLAMTNLNGSIKESSKALGDMNKIKVDSTRDGIQALGRVLVNNFIHPMGTDGVKSVENFVNSINEVSKAPGKQFAATVLDFQRKMFDWFTVVKDGRTGFGAFWSSATTWISQFTTLSLPMLKGSANAIMNLMQTGTIWWNNGGAIGFRALSSAASTAGNAILNAFVAVQEWWNSGGGQQVFSALGSVLSFVATTLANALSAVGSLLGRIATQLANWAMQNDAVRAGVEWFAQQGGVFGAIANGLQKVLDYLEPVTKAVGGLISDGFSKISAWWDENGEQITTDMSEFFSGLGALARATVPMFKRLGGIFSEVFTSIGEAIPKITGELAAFGRVLSGNEDELGDGFLGLLERIYLIVQPLAKSIGQGLLKVFKDLKAWFSENGDTMFAGLLGTLDAIRLLVKPVQLVIEGIFQGISLMVTGFMDTLSGLMGFIGGIVNGDWQQVWDSLLSILKGSFKMVLGFLILGKGKLVGWLGGIFAKIVAKLPPAFGAIGRLIVNGAKGYFKFITLPFRLAWNFLKKKFSGLGALISSIFSVAKDKLALMKDGMLSKIKAPFLAGWNWIKNKFSGAGSLATDLIDGFKNGIGDAAKGLKDAVTKPFKDAIGWVKGVLDIHSPSRVFKEIGEFTIQGYNKGAASEDITLADDMLAKLDTKRIKAETQNKIQTAIKLADTAVNMNYRTKDKSLTPEQFKQKQQAMYVNLTMGDRAYKAHIKSTGEGLAKQAMLDLGKVL